MTGQSASAIPACVVDANVLVKLFLPEAGSETAEALMGRPGDTRSVTRAVPDLAYVECANVFWKRVRQGSLPASAARDMLTDLRALPLSVWAAEPLLERSLALAVTFDVAVYDAVYLALSAQLAMPLVTADGILVGKAGGPSEQLCLLESFSP